MHFFGVTGEQQGHDTQNETCHLMDVKYFFRFHKTLFNDCNGANRQIIIFPNLQYYGKFDAFDSYDFSIHLAFPLCNSYFPFTPFFPGHFDTSLREASTWQGTQCLITFYLTPCTPRPGHFDTRLAVLATLSVRLLQTILFSLDFNL